MFLIVEFVEHAPRNPDALHLFFNGESLYRYVPAVLSKLSDSLAHSYKTQDQACLKCPTAQQFTFHANLLEQPKLASSSLKREIYTGLESMPFVIKAFAERSY